MASGAVASAVTRFDVKRASIVGGAKDVFLRHGFEGASMVLQRELAQTLEREGKTALLITHDLLEAVTLSDRVLVMSRRPGRIIDEIRIDLPQRADPLARRQEPKVNDYIGRLMERLDIGAVEVAGGSP